MVLGRQWWTFLLVAWMVGTGSARAVLFYDTSDSSHNTSAPSGAYLNSGWQWEGYYGIYLGTMISPNCFITTTHAVTGQTRPTTLISKGLFNGGGDVTYTIDASVNNGLGYWPIAGTQLSVLKVNQSFPGYAPLYTGSDEIGKELVVTGRGGPRGAAVYVNSELKGWRTNFSDLTPRWGRNTVTDIITPSVGSMLVAEFNAVSGIDEAQLSVGDSGGGVFIKQGSAWRLAGINYAADIGPWDLDSNHNTDVFNAALFDAGGLYYNDGNSWQFLPDQSYDIPGGFYASRISDHVAAITQITGSVPEPGSAVMLVSIGAWLALGWRRFHRG
jgi:hypothetical protein